MSMQAQMPATERLRLRGVMGIDVYVPRGTPLARTVDVAPVRATMATVARPPPSAAARVLIAGVDAEEHSPLLAAVLRGARLRRQDWALAGESTSTVPEWRFGDVEGAAARAPALALPSLGELRDSVVARRASWHVLRTWLRRT